MTGFYQFSSFASVFVFRLIFYLRQKLSVKILTYVKQKHNPKGETNKVHVSKHTELQLKKHFLNKKIRHIVTRKALRVSIRIKDHQNLSE